MVLRDNDKVMKNKMEGLPSKSACRAGRLEAKWHLGEMEVGGEVARIRQGSRRETSESSSIAFVLECENR